MVSRPAGSEHATNGNGTQSRTPYEDAVLGFREYWYPVCCTGDITETPKSYTLLGDPVAIVRRDGKAYAVKDECPHRGTQFSMINTRKNWEFPGTCTITCPYHGWTYDLKDGRCVAVISEGPESPVPQSGVRVRTYPIEERRGLIWIWMGSLKPVPVEDDIPNLMLDPKAVVRAFSRIKYGNWRFHAENPSGGHATMVHKSTLRQWASRGGVQQVGLPFDPGYVEDLDHKGISTNVGGGKPSPTREFPGLGEWDPKPRWQHVLFDWIPSRADFRRPVQGIRSSMLMLPGIFRQPNFPNTAYMYYEWYVPVDEDHYIYMQISCAWPKNRMDRIRYALKYYLWDRPTGPVLFNNQDAAMVAATTNYFKRTGNMHYLSKAPYDRIHHLWRAYANEQARGVGTKYRANAPVEAAGAFEESAPAATATMAGGGGG